MLTKNNTSSDLTHKRQTRMQFANYIIQQQALANGCLGSINIEGGSGGDKMASIFTEIKQGARYTTPEERDLILASNRCPSSAPAPEPAPAPGPIYASGDGVWGVGINAGTTTSGVTTRASWIDTNGNIYIGGSYSNAKLTVNSYTSLSGTDITQTLFGLLPQPSGTNNSSFIIKYNSSGVVQWATNLTATVGANLYNIATDANGDIYTTHTFNGTATVNSYGNDGGSGGDLTPSAYGTVDAVSTDFLVVKYSSSGAVQWVAQVTGSGNEQSSSGYSKNIAIDSNNNVLFTLRTTTSAANVTFKNANSGGGGGVITFNDFGLITGVNGTIYACKMNNTGKFQWVSQIKPTDANSGSDHMCAVDSNDNMYVSFTCNFNYNLESFSNVSLGTISTTVWGTNAALAAGARGGFVAKLNASGAFQAAARFSTINRTVVESTIVTDGNNNVIVAFRYYTTPYNAANTTNIYSFSGTDPAGGAIGFTAWGSVPNISAVGDGAILIFNSSLVAQSATYMSSSTSIDSRQASVLSIDRDANNNIFVNVLFQGSQVTIYNFSSGGGGLDANITTTTFGTIANSGNPAFYDVAIIKYNPSLVAQWATRLNGVVSQSDLPWTISVDRVNGFVYSAGEFRASNTGGYRLNTYGGVSGGAVSLNLFALIPSAASTSTNITQSYLVKYKA